MRFLIVIGVLYGAFYYASNHYKFDDTLVYAKNHPEASWAPSVDYYVGLVYYQRSEYPKAQAAFSQLLGDYGATNYYGVKALPLAEDSAESNRDWDTARQWDQAYIDAYPNGRDIELMRKRLELLNYQHPAAQ